MKLVLHICPCESFTRGQLHSDGSLVGREESHRQHKKRRRKLFRLVDTGGVTFAKISRL